MLTLAIRSLRYRSTTFTTAFVSIMLATALIGTFATMAQTAFGADGDDQALLFIIGGVVGSWGAVIALASLTSTLGITVSHRDREIALLRSLGCTAAKARRMIRVETLLVAVVACLIGAGIAWGTGRLLLELLQSNDVVASDIAYEGGLISLGITAAAIVAVALIAASITGRRATTGPVRLAGIEVSSGLTHSRMRPWRVIGGVLLIGYAAAGATLTVTVMAESNDVYAPMQTAGAASIAAAAGLACFAPWLVRVGSAALRSLGAPRLGGRAIADLVANDLTRRPGLFAGTLSPMIIFTATTVGVLMLVGIDSRTVDALVASSSEMNVITMLNYVVTGMISLFAGIMVVNSLIAVTGRRTDELRRLRLAGATDSQLSRMLGTEAAILAVIGVVLGMIAASATALSYSWVRGEGFLPDGQLWIVPATALVAMLLVVVTTVSAGRRQLRKISPQHGVRQVQSL